MTQQRHHDPAALLLTWDDSHAGAMALLPSGPIWPRDPTGTLSRLVRGLTGNHWRAWLRVLDMLKEADPRLCFETIDMWETDCGLPDPCVDPPPVSYEARRAAIVARRQEGGVSSVMQIIGYAASIGYDITITEFRPFRAFSLCNDFLNTDIAASAPWTAAVRGPGWPHAWLVTVLNTPIFWMTAVSACNKALREFGPERQLECSLPRMAPAQTELPFFHI